MVNSPKVYTAKQCSIILWQIMEIYQPPPQLVEHYKTKCFVIQVYRSLLQYGIGFQWDYTDGLN